MFNKILHESENELIARLHGLCDPALQTRVPLAEIATVLKLRPEQLICAVGFNHSARYLTEELAVLGYASFNELARDRNEIFVSDIYKRLTLENILKIYERIRNDQETVEVMQYLLKQRLGKIENEIESTVNSVVIDKYRSEMRTVYSLGIAGIDFAEDRLDRQDSGFRALLNEVSIIVENKIIPVGEIFFRDRVLPQEKLKLLNKGLIPLELVQSRINDEKISPYEKKVLNDYMKSNCND